MSELEIKKSDLSHQNHLPKTKNDQVIHTLKHVINDYIPQKDGRPIISADNFIKSSTLMLKRSNFSFDTNSILSALLHCAADGLMPDGRQAALVSYRGKEGPRLAYLPMYQGLIDIMYRYGAIQSLNAHLIYSNDTVDITLGSHEEIRHTYDIKATDRGEKVAVYAVAILKNGGKIHSILSKKEVVKIQQAAASIKGPWSTHEDEMWKKTAIRRLSKILPRTFDADIKSSKMPQDFHAYVPVTEDDIIHDVSNYTEVKETESIKSVDSYLEALAND